MEVSIKTFYDNTAASLKQLSRVSSVQRVNFRGSQTGIIQRLRTLRSDLRQPLGRPGRQSWHVDWQRAQWRHGWSSVRLHLEGQGWRSDDPRMRALLRVRGPAEGHDDPRPARDILLPRHHLVSKVVTSKLLQSRPNGT